MIVDHDPGDEHRDPWPVYAGEPFGMPASDDLAIMWIGRVPPRDGWHTAVVEFDRTTGRQAIVYLDGRVEDLTEAFEALRRDDE